MSLTASVVSAAILEGRLIIGLSDGSVIDCGYVQGPPGLSGEPGPMGATGDSGVDGNTILTVAGTPRNDMGKDGDYAIDNINWRIYGPKAGGVWGKANDMLPSKDNLIVNGRGFEGGAGGSGDSGGGGGGEGIRVIDGGDGITATAVTSAVTEVSADIDTTKGLQIDAGKIAINVGTGLEFDAATGAIKSQVNAADYAKITYVDAQDDALSVRIDSNDQLISVNAAAIAANTNEITSLNSDVDELQIKVETLEGASQSGVWALALTGSPRPGKVLLYKENFQPGVVAWNDVKFLGFYPEDAGGTTHDFSDVIEGEYIRFTPEASVGEENAVTFKATDVTAASSGVFGVEVSTKKGQPVNEESFGVEFLPPFDPSQYATVDYVDEQDKLKANKNGATLTGTYAFKLGGEVNAAISIQDADTTKASLDLWCPGGAGTQVKYVGRNGSDHWLQNYNQADDAVLTTAKFAYENYSFLAQPNITYEATNEHVFKGPVKLNGATSITGGFSVKTTGQTISTIFQVVSFSTPGASKAEYFGPIDTDNTLATKKYVDDQVGVNARPAQLSWIYDGEKSSSSAPVDGKFYKNGDYLRFSFKTYNGVDLSEDLCPDTGSITTQYGPVGVIWYYASATNTWKMKRQFRTDSWRWNFNNHFEFELSSSKGHAWGNLNQGTVYHITIGGWF